MYKVNDIITVKHRRLFSGCESLQGKIIDIRNFEGEDLDGYNYNQTSYHIKLDNGKRIIVLNKDARPPYLKFYSIN